jgi:hypothetical protein
MLWRSMKLVQCATTLVQVSRFFGYGPDESFQSAFLANRRLRAILPITPNPVSNIANVPGSAFAAAGATTCKGRSALLEPLPTTLPIPVPSRPLTFSSAKGDD